MAQSSITFNRNQTGLDRALSASDHLSSLLFYTAGSLPAGFASGDRIKKIFSVKEAENLGIVATHADETKGTGGQTTLTGTWIAGEIVRIEIGGASLGQFTLTTTTISSAVAGLVAAINANTSTGLKHGWVAVDADPIITLTQPAKLGVVNNAGNLVLVERNATDTGTSAGGGSTDVQFSSGVGSYFALMHYHISEYFRMQPDGVLWVGIYAQATYVGTEVKTIQDFAEGAIRQMGVLVTHESFAASHLTATQVLLDTLETEKKPLSVQFHSDMSATTASALPTLATLSNERTITIAGEDGDWHQTAWVNTKVYKPGDKVTFQGATYKAKAQLPVASPGDNAGPYDLTKWTLISINLPDVFGFSVSNLGTAVGTTSLASVHENIGYVDKFNLASGTGMDVAGLATGELYKDLTTALRDTLNDYHYTYMRAHQGLTGTWFNDDWTAIVETNDFATQENVRTMDKACRDIQVNLLPLLNGNIYVNADGTIDEVTIADYKNRASKALINMQNRLEISDYLVVINPAQDVLSTSEITLGITIVPAGVARQITVDVGFDVKLP